MRIIAVIFTPHFFRANAKKEGFYRVLSLLLIEPCGECITMIQVIEFEQAIIFLSRHSVSSQPSRF